MNEIDKKTLIDFYEALYIRHGPNYLGSGWPNQKDQIKRFRILTEIADLDDSSILDVGCGFGALYEYLKENFKNFEYKGIDISKKIIDAAKKKYPEADFRTHDLIEKDLSSYFDFVLLSGAFNPKLSDNWLFIKNLISRMFGSCIKGIAFNMFSDKVDYMDKKIHYQNQNQLRKYLQTLTDKIIERDDYMNYEFTVYLYKK